jgi:hypothetical protein
MTMTTPHAHPRRHDHRRRGQRETVTATFTVTLSAASGLPVTVSYATADDTAVQPTDYIAKSDTLTFTPGDTQRIITVTINGDTADEGASEQFFLNFSDVENGQLPDTQAVGTITDDDEAGTDPTITISGISVSEGDGTATITVTLSAPSSGTTTVDYATVDDTAVAGSDYTRRLRHPHLHRQ